MLKRFILRLFVSIIILLAVIMGGMRLVISNIEFFKPEIAYLLERDVSKGIVFNRVSGSLNRFNPVLRIENVSINRPDRSQPLFIDHLSVEFDFWSSLRNRAPVVFEISGKLEKLKLTQDVSGLWWLNDYQIGGGGEVVLPAFKQFLELLPRYLKLDLHRLIINDERHQSTHQLSNVAARIIHRNGQFHAQMNAELPEEFGRSLLLKSVIDPTSSSIYLNTSGLRMAPIARLLELDTQGLRKGALDGAIWFQMEGYKVTSISGDLDLSDGVLQVADHKLPLSINYLANFKALAGDNDWRVNSKIKRLSIGGTKVPGFDVQVKIPLAADNGLLSAWINRLPISSLPVVAGQWLPDTIDQQISEGRLQGLLQDVLFEINLDEVETFRMAAKIKGLNTQPAGPVPGVNNLNADLIVGHNKLIAKLQGENVSLDFGDQFRAPLQADSISLEVISNRQPSGNLLIEANDIQLTNQDVSAVGRMRIETDAQQAPFMYLRVAFSEAVASSTHKYIPVQLMPAGTIDWIDRGIIGGFVPEGDLLFHGRLRDVRKLNREHAGELFVDFAVEQADIFFAPGWLHARNGKGRVLFHNVGVQFDLEEASYEQIDGIKVQGGIADFEQAALDLSIQAEAATGDAVRVWLDTPVGVRFRQVLSNLQDYRGAVSSNIDIKLPLGKDVAERKVNVEIGFQDAAARAPGWELDLSQIIGSLKVTENTMTAAGISARFFDDPVYIDINSSNTALNTQVAVQGNLASVNLLRSLPSYLRDALSGNSDWQLRLDIAGDAAASDQPFLRINASSNLLETRVDLPKPFYKVAADTTRLDTEVRFYPQQIRFLSKLGDKIAGQGSLVTRDDQEYRLEALDIAFSRALQEKQRSGIHLYGRIDELNIDEWLSFFTDSGNDGPALLQSVELGVDRARAFGRDIESVVFGMHQVDQRFLGRVDSSMMKGSFEIPLQTSWLDPMIVDLEYLRIEPTVAEPGQTAIKPSSVPTFMLTSKSLRFHDMEYNDLLIDASSDEKTLKVSKFNFRRDELQLTSEGEWTFDESTGRHLSSLNVTLEGPELGEAMQGLGFGNSMSGGDIELTGKFSWPAPLFSFGLDIVEAEARLKITDGVLNNVEPGSGRFVGLLSLSALPRRLSLDFSDVLIDGLEFDEITGRYSIKDGILNTRDTRLDGPAANIKITGKTGIIDRDYDQVIRVTPKIRETLSLLGLGAVSAGTGVGWGLLLLQNLFKTAIDDAVEVEYHVTGSWDDPEIALLKAVDENQKRLPKNDK